MTQHGKKRPVDSFLNVKLRDAIKVMNHKFCCKCVICDRRKFLRRKLIVLKIVCLTSYMLNE